MHKTVFIGITIITTLILGMSVFLLAGDTNTSKVTASENAKVQIQESTHFDWGMIPINGGNVTKTFTIKNKGSDTLTLSNVKTSCHCTVANVTIDGETSDDFGMSGLSNWVGEVDPGNEARVEIMFDPAFHGPQGTGPVTRFVSLETNDSSNPKIMYTLTGTVVE